jgi:glyoxylase-like metal-dependent hydrolase (beta-lactamase superfamily II)
VQQAAENGMTVTAVIDTHVHADHVSCARQLAAASGAPLYLGMGAGVQFAYVGLDEGQVLDVGNRRVRVVRTPGHTAEHVCLVVDGWFVLTGDTLFVGDVGRVDLALDHLPGDAIRARAADLYRSLQRLLELPEWTEVYPGHFAGSVCGRGMDGKPITTIGRERRHNPALQLTEEAFIAYQTGAPPPLPPDFRAIKQRNLGAWQPQL